MKRERALIVGNGGFGTAMALILVENDFDVAIYGHDAEYLKKTSERRENTKFLAGVPLPASLRFEADPARAASGASLMVSAVPTRYLRATLRAFEGHLPAQIPILSVTKGIEETTLLRPTQIIEEIFPGHPTAVLSGPSHAEEVARRVPTSVVIASASRGVARRLQRAFNTERFRVYSNRDPIGVELAGALKNVVAIAAGVVDGLGFGDNAKASLLTRGLVEIVRLSRQLGARKQTFAGLAGIGDLITTSFSKHGRNRAVGEQIGRGRSLQEILAGMEMVAEGVTTTKAVMALAVRHGIEMPISQEVHEMLFHGKDPKAALKSLMARSSKVESW